MVYLVQRGWNSSIIFRNGAGCAKFYSTWQSIPWLETQLLVSILSLLFLNLEFNLQKYPYMSVNLLVY